MVHSKRVDIEVKRLLTEISEDEQIMSFLKQEIDGIARYDLMKYFAGWAHDLGKWSDCFYDKNGKLSQDKHEAASGVVVLDSSSEVHKSLTQPVKDCGFTLTEEQIEYIATCASLHFELGKLRNAAKKSKLGYTVKWTETIEFEQAVIAILNQHPEHSLEVILLFMADSAGKINLNLVKSKMLPENYTDADIEGKRVEVEEMLAQRGLNSNLINGILQLPVNQTVYKRALEVWKNWQSNQNNL